VVCRNAGETIQKQAVIDLLTSLVTGPTAPAHEPSSEINGSRYERPIEP
jgi:hypothetical protein